MKKRKSKKVNVKVLLKNIIKLIIIILLVYIVIRRVAEIQEMKLNLFEFLFTTMR